MLPPLATARLALAAIRPEDVDPLWLMLLLPEVRRYLCDDRMLPRAAVLAFAADNAALERDRLGLRVIRDGAGLAGFVAIKPVSEEIAACIPHFRGEIELSFGLHPRCWRLGYGREASEAALADWHRHGDGRRVVAVADVPNANSRRLLARLGFAEAAEHDGPAYRLVSFTPARAPARAG